MRQRQAFTLFEVVLVLAVIIVLSALAYPSLDSMYGEFRLTAATDQVRARWAEARARAMDEGRPYRFAVVPNQGNFRIAPDSADFWSGNGDAASNSDAPPLVLEETLPKRVRFVTSDTPQEENASPGGEGTPGSDRVDPSKWTRVVTFLPDGSARDDVEIVFQSRGARPLRLKLRGLTGAVTVKPITTEDAQR